MPSSRFHASARDQLRAERAAARVGRLPSMSVTQRAEVFHALLPDVLRDILLSVGRKLRADRGTRGVVPVVLLEFESPEALSLAVDKLLLLRAFVSHLPVRATGQGLAPGQAQAARAQIDEGAAQAVQFLDGEDLGLGQELLVLGHAVGAAQVAAVGDGEAQITDAPLVRIEESALPERQGRRGGLGDRVRRRTVVDQRVGHLPPNIAIFVRNARGAGLLAGIALQHDFSRLRPPRES
jgi:hypothetical protein